MSTLCLIYLDIFPGPGVHLPPQVAIQQAVKYSSPTLVKQESVLSKTCGLASQYSAKAMGPYMFEIWLTASWSYCCSPFHCIDVNISKKSTNGMQFVVYLGLMLQLFNEKNSACGHQGYYAHSSAFSRRLQTWGNFFGWKAQPNWVEIRLIIRRLLCNLVIVILIPPKVEVQADIAPTRDQKVFCIH